MPRSALRSLALALVVTALSACSDGSGPSNPLAKVIGAWQTELITVDAIGGAGHETLAEGNALTLEIQSDGDFVVRQNGSALDFGTLTLHGDSLTFRSGADQSTDPYSMSWRFDGEALLLGSPGAYDFTADGLQNPVPATLTYRFIRS